MDDKERIAVLETKVELLESNMTILLNTQQEIKEQLTKYKGFIGGVVFLGSCLWALFVVIAKKLGIS